MKKVFHFKFYFIPQYIKSPMKSKLIKEINVGDIDCLEVTMFIYQFLISYFWEEIDGLQEFTFFYLNMGNFGLDIQHLTEKIIIKPC